MNHLLVVLHLVSAILSLAAQLLKMRANTKRR
jgi:hypothetical protein